MGEMPINPSVHVQPTLHLEYHPSLLLSSPSHPPLAYTSTPMLREVFSPKPYDFTTLFTSWPDAPIFTGHLKKDGPVSDWLQKIKTGCKLRKVPKVIRHDVAEHYLNGKAKKRFESLKVVMRNLHGGKYKWDWKKFEIAMVHMCCEFCLFESSFLWMLMM